MSLYGPDTLFQLIVTVYDRPTQNIGLQVLGLRVHPELPGVAKALDACLRSIMQQLVTATPQPDPNPEPQGEPVCPTS